MYETIDEIVALFGVTGESLDLEFKSSRAYDDMTRQEQRCEFVKDVTGFANAGGSTLIIGVAQEKPYTSWICLKNRGKVSVNERSTK